MAASDHLVERDNCIICLLTEEEAVSSLILNNRCNCKYTYHKECIKGSMCPICNTSFTKRIQQSNDESKVTKVIICIIFILVLSVTCYFSSTVHK